MYRCFRFLLSQCKFCSGFFLWLLTRITLILYLYFDSFGFEHIPEETKRLIGNGNIITNTIKIQIYDSIMFPCFCIGFNGLMFSCPDIDDLKSWQILRIYSRYTILTKMMKQFLTIFFEKEYKHNWGRFVWHHIYILLQFDDTLRFRLTRFKKIKDVLWRKSMLHKNWARHWISISLQLTRQTRRCLFCWVQIFVYFFTHLVLFLIHLFQ